MDSTRKRLLAAAAVFYGGFLVIRLPPVFKELFPTTGDETKMAFYAEIIEYNFPLRSMTWWDYLSVAILIIAVGLTFAAFRMRAIKPTHLKI